MAKIEVNQAAEIIKKHKVEPSILREIVEEMNLATQPDGDEDIKPPAQKKQYVILLSDPAGSLPKVDLVGWVLQIPEDASPLSTQERIHKGAYDFNASKRGRLLPVKSIGESIESVSAKYFKEAELWVKTKLPVQILTTDNVLPRDEFKVEKIERRGRLVLAPGESEHDAREEAAEDRSAEREMKDVNYTIKLNGKTALDTAAAK